MEELLHNGPKRSSGLSFFACFVCKILLTQSGQGAYNRVPSDATAFVRRDELFLFKHTAVDPDASTAERKASRSWLARSWASVHP